MIEHFRHEALNQVSVISGFCEIIEHRKSQLTDSATGNFDRHLQKLKRLSQSFNNTLQVFRDGCDLKELTEAMLHSMDPTSDILPYLSSECAIQYSVLKETAEALAIEAKRLGGSCDKDGSMSDRCSYIVTSAQRLHELFLRPFAYLQEDLKNNSK